MGDEKKTGRKLEDEVRDFLKEASLSLAPGEVQRAQAMTEIRKAVRKKIIQRQPSLRELLMVELRYISPGFWVLQGSLVLLLAAGDLLQHLGEPPALVGDIALVMVCKGQPHHIVVPGKGADLIQGGMGVVGIVGMNMAVKNVQLHKALSPKASFLPPPPKKGRGPAR